MSRGRTVATGIGITAAVARTRPPQAARPTRTTQTRAVPRSRMVSRSARYSSSSRGVTSSTWASSGRCRGRRARAWLGRLGPIRQDVERPHSSVSGVSTIIALQSMNCLLECLTSATITYGSGLPGEHQTIFPDRSDCARGGHWSGWAGSHARRRRAIDEEVRRQAEGFDRAADRLHGRPPRARAPRRPRARWPTRSFRATRSTRAASSCPTFAPPPPSSTTPKPTRCSWKRTR